MLTNSADIIRRLKRDGFVLKSVRGSHHKFVHEATKRMTVVPHPKRDIPIGTVHGI
ncbi:type II toxin-antitoxin system HicA family toxin [Bosea sp. (in: a-proteobacteria)]|uniref:type II toxin-antitoxin system HicA family toxin n=1 Tax=Bosea sp. (in: a-proteobacteria) TaxID=1871050 RepID=UPI00121B4463|nr:type II toxin-antitoxin system HicA family toxin [Bosea sp. (in: a-proteobacteria)]TAJ26950.1 MAG: addiction module toxin, HicA family [Bosea sp. (in: a-proteobacteria)]